LIFIKAEKSDYWKDKKPVEPIKTDEEKIALTRDWLAREDPDSTPFHGFFSVWPVVTLSISGFCCVLSFLCGCVHLLGGEGKRSQIETANKEYELEQQKIQDFKEKRRIAGLQKESN